MGKWTQAALAVKERMEQTETARDELRADLSALASRLSVLKTIYPLLPAELRAIIEKYIN